MGNSVTFGSTAEPGYEYGANYGPYMVIYLANTDAPYVVKVKVGTSLGDSEHFVQITNNRLIVPQTGNHQPIVLTKVVAPAVSENAVRGKRFNVETFAHTLNAAGLYTQTAGGGLSWAPRRRVGDAASLT